MKVIRHRSKNGVREYKVDGNGLWVTRDAIPESCIEDYEAKLVAKVQRRVRMRSSTPGVMLPICGGDEEIE